jgi:hypothetical protein
LPKQVYHWIRELSSEKATKTTISSESKLVVEDNLMQNKAKSIIMPLKVDILIANSRQNQRTEQSLLPNITLKMTFG